jgi:transcriptional regulator
VATLLPILWDDDVVVGHLAKANPQWRSIAPDSPALMICSGPEAYISPSWYAAKAEHGRVVPTWNYSAVHLTGTVRVIEDREWSHDVVTRPTAAEWSRVWAANPQAAQPMSPPQCSRNFPSQYTSRT